VQIHWTLQKPKPSSTSCENGASRMRAMIQNRSSCTKTLIPPPRYVAVRTNNERTTHERTTHCMYAVRSYGTPYGDKVPVSLVSCETERYIRHLCSLSRRGAEVEVTLFHPSTPLCENLRFSKLHGSEQYVDRMWKKLPLSLIDGWPRRTR
jgi:hypothetical protein